MQAKKTSRSWRMPLDTSRKAAALFRKAIPKEVKKTQECFMVLPVDGYLRPLCAPHINAIGTVDRVNNHARDIFRYAIRINASGIIVAHTHPSGDPEPSEGDFIMFQAVASAGEFLQIPVFDQIVIGYRKHFSLNDAIRKGDICEIPIINIIGVEDE